MFLRIAIADCPSSLRVQVLSGSVLLAVSRNLPVERATHRLVRCLLPLVHFGILKGSTLHGIRYLSFSLQDDREQSLACDGVAVHFAHRNHDDTTSIHGDQRFAGETRTIHAIETATWRCLGIPVPVSAGFCPCFQPDSTNNGTFLWGNSVLAFAYNYMFRKIGARVAENDVKIPRKRSLSTIDFRFGILLASPPFVGTTVTVCVSSSGSPLENWHSILRRGLFVASGTPLMRNGAAYGKGIYLSSDPTLSYGYACRSTQSKLHGQWTRYGKENESDPGIVEVRTNSPTYDCNPRRIMLNVVSLNGVSNCWFSAVVAAVH